MDKIMNPNLWASKKFVGKLLKQIPIPFWTVKLMGIKLCGQIVYEEIPIPSRVCKLMGKFLS